MLGCNKCGHIWDNCECPDIESISADRDVFDTVIQEEESFDSKDLGSHYRHEYNGVKLDVYRILDVYNITDAPQQHAIKKLLRGVSKGHTELEFWTEVKQIVERKIEMMGE
jgi:hypothetical protein